MDAVMYILVPVGLSMSKGKMAAQAAHAATEATLLSHPSIQWPLAHGNLWVPEGAVREALWNAWRSGGHYKKIVLECEDLFVAERYLRDRGFRTAMILDEGRTEFNGGLTPTAMGVALTDKSIDHVKQTFSSFNLYGTKERKDRAEFEAAVSGKENHLRTLRNWILDKPGVDGLWSNPSLTNTRGWRFGRRK